MSPRPSDPSALERQLRRRFTDPEYRLLQARLTGAVKGIAMLRERAADLLPLLLGAPLAQARVLPPHTQIALSTLIEELLAAAAADAHGHLNRRALLRLVERVIAQQP